MNPAYRIPLGKFPLVARFTSQETATNTPITEIVVNSLITSPAEGARVRAGQRTTIGGIAWDGGYGINNVEVSSNDGKTWSAATLGPDLGRYAFRTWSFVFTPSGKGKTTVMARATNKIGQAQTSELILNPAGYHHNVIHRLTLDVA
jgi:Mo-co oxidoreductase dimerisation domain